MTCIHCAAPHVCVTEGDRDPVCYEHLLSPPTEGPKPQPIPEAWTRRHDPPAEVKS